MRVNNVKRLFLEKNVVSYQLFSPPLCRLVLLCKGAWEFQPMSCSSRMSCSVNTTMVSVCSLVLHIFSFGNLFFFSVKIVAGFFWGIVVTLRFLTRATWIAGNVHRFTNFVAKRRPCKLKGEFDNQFIETKMSYRQKRCLEESTLLPWKFIKSLYRVWIKATYLPAYHSASKLVQK